jgi:hypothetical protein
LVKYQILPGILYFLLYIAIAQTQPAQFAFGPKVLSDPGIIGLVGFEVLTAVVNE